MMGDQRTNNADVSASGQRRPKSVADNVPTPLTTSDERLVELLRAGRPDAEIAVKLGLSVPELRIRMENLAARLGVPGRAGLATWSPGDSARLASHGKTDDFPDWAPVIGARTAGKQEPDEDLGEEPGGTATIPAEPRRMSRRGMLGLIAGGAVTVVGAGYLASRRRGGGLMEEGEPAFSTPEPFQTATPGPRGGPIPVQGLTTLQPNGLPTAFDAASLMTWTDGTEPLVLTHFAPGEPVTARTGVYFMDPETGDIEGADGDPTAEFYPVYMVSPDGRFVGFNGTATGLLLDRVNKRVATWNTSEMRLLKLGAEMALFGQQRSPSFDPKTGFYELIALTDVPGFQFPKVFQLDDRASIIDVLIPETRWPVHVLYWYQGDSGIVSITSLSTRPILDYSLGSERELGATPQALVETGPGQVSVTGRETAVVGDDGQVTRGVTLAQLDLAWETSARTTISNTAWFEPLIANRTPSERLAVISQVAEPPLEWSRLTDTSIIDFSPDGRLVAWEQVEREIHSDDDGPMEIWLSVVVAEAETMEPLFRVRSAALRYGDGQPDSRWIADSSGIVVAVRAVGAAGGYPRDQAEYAIVAANGDILERLPLAPVEPDEWYRHPAIYAPVPSPTRPELFAYGRLSTYNLKTGEWQHSSLVSQEGPMHLSPWASGGDELVFSPDHGGHDGGNGPLFLPARIEKPPFDDTMRFRVVVDTCLNLRTDPNPEAEVLECLEPGTTVDLLSGPRITGDRFSVSYHESGTYVLVGWGGGIWGWAAADYLEWA